MGADGDVGGAASTSGKLVEAVVEEALPSDLYRVKLSDGATVLAHVSDRRQRNFLRLLPGDRVRVRLSPYDERRGRIVERDGK